jgi:regulator of RNase E activity RraB
MKAQWGVFSRELEDKVAVVSVDFAWLPLAPVADAPILAAVHLRLKHPREDGLPDHEESDELTELEAHIEEKLQDEGRFVSRVWGNGFRDLYFYISESTAIDPLLGEAFSHGYRISTSRQSDPGWLFYLQTLAPSAWEMVQLENNQIIAQHLENGDEVNTPRKVDHFLYLPTTEAREQASADAVANGFELVESLEGELAPYPFGLHLARHDAVTPVAISHPVGILFQLAHELGGEYEGWSSPVVHSQ